MLPLQSRVLHRCLPPFIIEEGVIGEMIKKLIEEITSLIQKKNGPYDLKNKAVHEFLKIAENIKLTGYESNAQATFFGYVDPRGT